MVASDTVVGLVGAGVLLVALVGVFIYESQQGSAESGELKNVVYNAKGTGSVTVPAGNAPQQLPPGAPCVAPVCTGASTNVDLSFENLPNAGALKYVVFLTGGTNTYKVGELTLSGEKYSIKHNTNNRNNDKNTVVVSLEKSSSATTPGWQLFSFPVSQSVSFNGQPMFLGQTGNHTLSFTPEGSNVNVTSVLREVPNKSGYSYRGWLISENETGKSYTFVGNYTLDHGGDQGANMTMGPKANFTLGDSAPGARDDYNTFAVTIEASEATIGDRPGGPIVISAAYNPVNLPTVTVVP